MTAAVQAASAHVALFDVVLLVHVVAAVVALGAVVASWSAAARVRSARQGPLAAGVVRYFAPGINWAGRTLHAVPLLGVALVALSRGAYGFDDGWVQAGLGLWAVAAVVAEGLLWPAERRVQAGLSLLAGATGTSGAGSVVVVAAPVPPAVRADCVRVVLAAAAVGALLLTAMVVMVVRP